VTRENVTVTFENENLYSAVDLSNLNRF